MKQKNIRDVKKASPSAGISFIEQTGRLSIYLPILVCILLPFIIYFNSLKTPFVFDDYSNIVDNPDIKQMSNLKTKLIYSRWGPQYATAYKNDPSRPMVYLSFTLNYYFGKLNTFGYHFVNVFIHIFNTLLVFLLARKIIFYSRIFVTDTAGLTDPYNQKKENFLLPLIVALFFASHPINTEAVTYISHRSDSLATFFYLTAIISFIGTVEGRKSLYVVSILSFIFSLLSKEIAATLPMIILMLDYILLSDFKVEKTIGRKYLHLPFWALIAAFVAFRYFYFGQLGNAHQLTYQNWTHYSYFITQLFVIWKYIKILFVPVGQSIDHFIEPSKTIFEGRIVASGFILTGISLLFYFISTKRPSLSKLILFSGLWFIITLSPTSSFMPINDAMAERRMYLPGIGFYLLLVGLYLYLFKPDLRENISLSNGKMFLFFLGIHILLLSIATWKRNSIFQNPISLWQDTLKQYPKNYGALNALGLMYAAGNEQSQAVECYEKAIEIKPKDGQAYVNMGNLYYQRGGYGKALQYFEKAIEVAPDYAGVYINLGNIYTLQGQYEKALPYYEKATALNPDSAEVYNNIGMVYFRKENYAEASKYFERATTINPDFALAHDNLGNSYHFQGKDIEALNEFKIASSLLPDNKEIIYKISDTEQLLSRDKRN